MSLDEWAAEHHAAKRPRQDHPDGLDPGCRLDKDGNGTAVVAVPAGQDPDWDRLLSSMGFGDVLQLMEVTEVRAWHGYDGRVLHYFKARVRRRDSADKPDVDELTAEIMRHRPRKIAKRKLEDTALVVCLADWQTGKRDGDGLAGLQQRLGELHDLVTARLKREKPSRLVVAGMGDIVEGCDGFYPMQAFGVELDRRRQCRFARRWIVRLVATWARYAPEVVVVPVAGNHGENRRDGKAFTSWGDNDDVAVFEQAAEIFSANAEAYGHVRWLIPEDGLTASLDVYGHVVAFAHGHQARSGGGGSLGKLRKWWRDMQHARHPIGEADTLVTGHYHHLSVVEDGSRTWLQCPTLDGGSEWWQQQGGSPSKPGTLTFLVDANGWRGLEVLR